MLVCYLNINVYVFQISLFLFYAGLLCFILLAVLINKENSPRLASTITRKYFHFFILLVFIPGTVINRQFMYFASTMIVSLFIILEVSVYASNNIVKYMLNFRYFQFHLCYLISKSANIYFLAWFEIYYFL